MVIEAFQRRFLPKSVNGIIDDNLYQRIIQVNDNSWHLYLFFKTLTRRQSSSCSYLFKRGKSGLQERQCRVTPGRGNSRESAAENIPPYLYGKGEKVW